jgi:hypothetical protein
LTPIPRRNTEIKQHDQRDSDHMKRSNPSPSEAEKLLIDQNYFSIIIIIIMLVF